MDNLSDNQNITFLSAKDAESLQRQLQNIKLNYQIVSIYAFQGRHFAWIIPSMPVKKVVKKQSVIKDVKERTKTLKDKK